MVSNDPKEVGSATMKAIHEVKRANKPPPMSQGGGFVHFAQKSAGRSHAWATEIYIIIHPTRIFIQKKNFNKGIDKSRKMCYNLDTNQGGNDL